VVVIGVLVAAVLALGGTALERAVSAAGINPVAVTDPSTTTTTRPEPGLHASTAALLGIVALHPRIAPAIPLVDASGHPFSLATLRGKVVVLTFFNANCADACPVIAEDLRRADAALGANRGGVVLVTVNTDPLEVARRPAPPAVTATGLARLSNWRYLTGPLSTINQVWRRYGVTIDVYPSTGRVTHNDVLYLIDPRGRLRLRATPVADESTSGTFALPADLVRRSGAGIAAYAARLLAAPR
jgi:cytochrome oxidase Cu insertion factor (SCO1/SenC/PrrC family)